MLYGVVRRGFDGFWVWAESCFFGLLKETISHHPAEIHPTQYYRHALNKSITAADPSMKDHILLCISCVLWLGFHLHSLPCMYVCTSTVLVLIHTCSHQNCTEPCVREEARDRGHLSLKGLTRKWGSLAREITMRLH